MGSNNIGGQFIKNEKIIVKLILQVLINKINYTKNVYHIVYIIYIIHICTYICEYTIKPEYYAK